MHRIILGLAFVGCDCLIIISSWQASLHKQQRKETFANPTVKARKTTTQQHSLNKTEEAAKKSKKVAAKSKETTFKPPPKGSKHSKRIAREKDASAQWKGTVPTDANVEDDDIGDIHPHDQEEGTGTGTGTGTLKQSECAKTQALYVHMPVSSWWPTDKRKPVCVPKTKNTVRPVYTTGASIEQLDMGSLMMGNTSQSLYNLSKNSMAL